MINEPKSKFQILFKWHKLYAKSIPDLAWEARNWCIVIIFALTWVKSLEYWRLQMAVNLVLVGCCCYVLRCERAGGVRTVGDLVRCCRSRSRRTSPVQQVLQHFDGLRLNICKIGWIIAVFTCQGNFGF